MIKSLQGIKQNIHEDTFIAENASVIGDVNIGEGTSIWYNAVLIEVYSFSVSNTKLNSLVRSASTFIIVIPNMNANRTINIETFLNIEVVFFI